MSNHIYIPNYFNIGLKENAMLIAKILVRKKNYKFSRKKNNFSGIFKGENN